MLADIQQTLSNFQAKYIVFNTTVTTRLLTQAPVGQAETMAALVVITETLEGRQSPSSTLMQPGFTPLM